MPCHSLGCLAQSGRGFDPCEKDRNARPARRRPLRLAPRCTETALTQSLCFRWLRV